MADVHDALGPPTAAPRHPAWVRLSHWVVAVSLLALAFSGIAILMVHPRLYWGEVGNDLTPPLLELPISRNHRHGGWVVRTRFSDDAAGPVSAARTYDIFNQNGWARSLHFLAAWWFVLTGAGYLVAGLGGHFRARLWPTRQELSPRLVWGDILDHARFRVPTASRGSPYGLLQKSAYTVVVMGLAPLMVLSGLAMSPAVTSALPFLVRAFGGYQSARTIHFFAFVALALFVLVHVSMVVRTGFARQMRAMTIGD